MAVDTITSSRSYLTRQLSTLNTNLTDKTTQLATGKVARTYGGLGDQRLLDLQLTQKVSRIDAYSTTITQTNLHINMMNLTLERMEALRIEAKSAIDVNDFELQADGQTRSQATTEILLHEAVSLLNSEVAGHYLYGGSAETDPPVESVDVILNGTGSQAGLKTVMSEYAQANLGANNNGRMNVSALTTNYAAGSPTDSTFTIAEDGAHSFGFDISSVTSTLSNTTVTGPGGGDPDSFDVQLTGQPVIGEKITVELTLPPAHTATTTIELTASDSNSAKGNFIIGADLEATATNLRAALSSALEEQAQTELKAVSDEWAADQFFDTYNGVEPMRVDGPPFNTATALTAGGAVTVAWYKGENTATTDPRGDKTAVIDDNLTVKYGARANEQGLTDVIKSMSAFVAADFSGGTAIDEQYYTKLADNMRKGLEPNNSDQSGVVDITTEIAIAFRTVEATDARHTQMKSSYEGTIADIEGIDKELVAMEILELQTNIEASYRATSIVLNLSLTSYL